MAIDIIHGTGYRVGLSDRPVGEEATGHPDTFVVLNQQNNKIFLVTGGIWVDGGTFPNANFSQIHFDTWLLS